MKPPVPETPRQPSPTGQQPQVDHCSPPMLCPNMGTPTPLWRPRGAFPCRGGGGDPAHAPHDEFYLTGMYQAKSMVFSPSATAHDSVAMPFTRVQSPVWPVAATKRISTPRFST